MQVLVISLAVCHSVMLVLFVGMGIWGMALTNMVSVITYVTCIIAVQKKKSLLGVIYAAHIEIILYAIISTVLIGLQCGTHLYLIGITMHAFYITYQFRAQEKRPNPMLYVMTALAAFALIMLLSFLIEPVYPIGDTWISKLYHVINYLIIIGVNIMFLSTLMTQILTMEGELKSQNDCLEVLSRQDALTGLCNRRRVEEVYTELTRQKKTYMLILGDIDDFKQVNDIYGHTLGDAVLKRVGEVFLASVRKEDVVCRWGGEEILVLLPDCSSSGAGNIANRILNNIRQQEFKADDGKWFRISMTMGVASSEEGEDMKEAVRKADERLYKGKRSGKNCVIENNAGEVLQIKAAMELS